MTAATRYAVRFILAGFTVFTIGMVASTAIDRLYGTGTDLSYRIFGFGLSLGLLSIAYAACSITPPTSTLGRWCIFFLMLAFSNLGDELTKSADVYHASEFWLAAGMVFYIAVIAKQKIRK